MQLWSWQEPGFSLFEGSVDHEQSEYVRSVAGIREAYRGLAQRLGTNQLIWCYTVRDEYIRFGTRVEWVLDVPTTHVLAFMDGIVWNRILGIKSSVPQELRWQWTQEAIRLFMPDVAAAERHEQECYKRFWDQAPPPGGWWTKLFVEPQVGETIWALLAHPISKGCVRHRPFLNP